MYQMPAVITSAKFFSRPCHNSSPFSCHNKQMITVDIKQINQFAGNQHCNGFSDFYNCFLLTGMFLYAFINSTNDHAAAYGHWVNLQTRGPKSGPRYFFNARFLKFRSCPWISAAYSTLACSYHRTHCPGIYANLPVHSIFKEHRGSKGCPNH